MTNPKTARAPGRISPLGFVFLAVTSVGCTKGRRVANAPSFEPDR